MSLSDYIKYLRAANGGMTPWEIAEGSGVSAREIHLLEVKHRRIGENDEMLKRLSAFFNVPLAELTRRRDAYRKRLTAFLEDSQQQSAPVALRLESGEVVEGYVDWFAREAVAVTNSATKQNGADPGLATIVQRCWVSDWRRSDAEAWEVESGPGDTD